MTRVIIGALSRLVALRRVLAVSLTRNVDNIFVGSQQNHIVVVRSVYRYVVVVSKVSESEECTAIDHHRKF